MTELTKQELQKRLDIALELQKKASEAGHARRAAGFDALIKKTTRQLLEKGKR